VDRRGGERVREGEKGPGGVNRDARRIEGRGEKEQGEENGRGE